MNKKPEMFEKNELKSQPRQTIPVVTRADTVSDELKARTLAAMEAREKEKRKAGLRKVPRFTLVAAIAILTLLMATGAAFALRSWWQDFFEVNQTQTTGGYTVKISKARFANEFLYIDVQSSRNVYLHFEGRVYNDHGDEAEIISGYEKSEDYETLEYEAHTHTLFVPELRNVIAVKEKSYHCELTVYAINVTRINDQTVLEQLPPDAEFHFNFAIRNDYIRSAVKSKICDIDCQCTLDQITFDFRKLYVSEVQTTLMAELIFHQEGKTDELILPQKLCPTVGVRLCKDDGTYYDGNFWTSGCVLYRSKYYILLNYTRFLPDAEKPTGYLDAEPPYTFEVSYIRFDSYRKTDEKNHLKNWMI